MHGSFCSREHQHTRSACLILSAQRGPSFKLTSPEMLLMFFWKGENTPFPSLHRKLGIIISNTQGLFIWFPSGRDPAMASSLAAGPVGHAVILVTEWDVRLCEGDPITVTSRGCDMIWVQITELSDRVSIFPSLWEPVDSSNEMLKS